MDNSGIYTLIEIGFLLLSFTTLLFFYWAMLHSRSQRTRKMASPIAIALVGWMILQFYISNSGTYSGYMNAIPPKIALFGILPTFVLIIFLFITKSGRQFMDSLPLRELTYLNIIRIPVEIVLLLLAVHETIPYVMTFEGLNFDILAGMTAPFMVYFIFVKKNLNPIWLLVWNIVCLGMLITIITLSILSAPSPFQYFIFNGQSFAMLEFPFSWLPTFIVPIVLFGHFASIRQLMKSRTISKEIS